MNSHPASGRHVPGRSEGQTPNRQVSHRGMPVHSSRAAAAANDLEIEISRAPRAPPPGGVCHLLRKLWICTSVILVPILCFYLCLKLPEQQEAEGDLRRVYTKYYQCATLRDDQGAACGLKKGSANDAPDDMSADNIVLPDIHRSVCDILADCSLAQDPGEPHSENRTFHISCYREKDVLVMGVRISQELWTTKTVLGDAFGRLSQKSRYFKSIDLLSPFLKDDKFEFSIIFSDFADPFGPRYRMSGTVQGDSLVNGQLVWEQLKDDGVALGQTFSSDNKCVANQQRFV